MKSVKSVTYGAMSVALVAMFFLLDRLFVGNLGFIMSLVIPIPLIIYGIKFSLKESFVVYLTMIVASFIFNGMPPAMLSMAGFGLVGLVYLYTYEQEYSALRKNILLFLSMAAIYLIMIFLYSDYFGLSIPDTIETIVRFYPDLSYQVLLVVSWLSVGLTILMEMYIINTSVKLLQSRLNKHLRK